MSRVKRFFFSFFGILFIFSPISKINSSMDMDKTESKYYLTLLDRMLVRARL